MVHHWSLRRTLNHLSCKIPDACLSGGILSNNWKKKGSGTQLKTLYCPKVQHILSHVHLESSPYRMFGRENPKASVHHIQNEPIRFLPYRCRQLVTAQGLLLVASCFVTTKPHPQFPSVLWWGDILTWEKTNHHGAFWDDFRPKISAIQHWARLKLKGFIN